MSIKVSIIMGVYNCGETLRDALDSIISQTFLDWELIICDDGSNDNTYQIAEEYCQNYPEKIILLKNAKNLRLAATLNRCAKVARGEYLARMDGDDISLPTRLAKQVAFLDSHPEYAIVGTYMRAFDEKGIRNIVPVKQIPQKRDLALMTPFNHATILIRKNVFDELNGYLASEKTIQCEDVELWFRFYAAGYQGFNLIEPLYMVRENQSTVGRRTWRRSLAVARLNLQGINMLGLSWYYNLYALKPMLSMITPMCLKRWFRHVIHRGNL